MLVPRPTMAVADLSFISLRRAFPVLRRILEPCSMCFLLVKPQFEAGAEALSRGGIVREESVRLSVVRELEQAAIDEGFKVLGTCESSLTGTDGNQEYFLWLQV